MVDCRTPRERTAGSDPGQAPIEAVPRLPTQFGEQPVRTLGVVANQDEIAAGLQRRPGAE